MPCPKTPFPRANVPDDFGTKVRDAREGRGWSKSGLAKRVGVTPKTILRLERSQTVPGLNLVSALLRKDVLGQSLPYIKGWEFDEPDAWKRGLRARAARHASDQNLIDVVAKAGGSIASLSSFERGLLIPKAYGGDPEDDDGNTASEAYAQALGFTGVAEMRAYLEADDPLPWLNEIARRHGRKLPPAALLPTRLVRVIDDTSEIPSFLLD